MRSLRYLVVLLLIVSSVAATPSAMAAAPSTKKGVSAANFPGTAEALADSRSSWYYNWASDPKGVVAPNGVEFVPMIWGSGSVTDAELNAAKSSGKTLLAFNEPDIPGDPDYGAQANMTVEKALELWPKLQATGMRLSAPAVAWGGFVDGGWLDRFMKGAAERNLRVDFIPLHWYGKNFSNPDAAVEELKVYIKAVYDRYHKPIWLTEYGLMNFEKKPPLHASQAEQANFARKSVAMLESLSFVERYAWFTLSTKTDASGLYTDKTPNETGVAYRDATAPNEAKKEEPKKEEPKKEQPKKEEPKKEEPSNGDNPEKVVVVKVIITVVVICESLGVDPPVKPEDQKPEDQKPDEQKPEDQKPGNNDPGNGNPGNAKPGDHSVTFVNNSGETVWLGSTVNADGSKNLTGLPTLQNGQSATVDIPDTDGPEHWRGKFFARQGCSGESGSTFHCKVGDCGKFADRCDTGDQPASLAEFNFDRKDNLGTWYNVSYVNAFSLPITIQPRDAKVAAGSKECEDMGCSKNLLSACPSDNLTKRDDGSPLLCTNPNRDAKTAYSNALQSACPQAYAWSKQDAEAGNQTVRQCKECSGFTVTFHSGK